MANEITMLDVVKLALRISTNAFDVELQLYIDDCLLELKGLGVVIGLEPDPQIKTTIIAYVKWKFGNNEDKEQWEAIYHTKLAQLQTMTNYTDWGEDNG